MTCNGILLFSIVNIVLYIVPLISCLFKYEIICFSDSIIEERETPYKMQLISHLY